MNELYGMTAEFAADALAADLEELFAGQLFQSSAGEKRPMQVHVNDLPVRTGNDEDRSQDAPEPYIIVRIGEGTIPEGDAAQEVQIVLVVALYDDRPDRQGYRDLLHIIQEIAARYCKNPVICAGGKFGRPAGDFRHSPHPPAERPGGCRQQARPLLLLRGVPAGAGLFG